MGKFSQLLHNLFKDCVTTQCMGKFTHNMGKFTQSLHILCNDCVNTRNGQRFTQYMCNICVNLYPCYVIIQSLHKICNNWVDLHLCHVNIYPSSIYRLFAQSLHLYYVSAHQTLVTRGWNTGTKVCRTWYCEHCCIYETPFAWFDLEHKVIPIWKSLCFRNIHLLLWRAPFRWNFVTRANKSDSLVTSRLKKEEPVFLFFS